MHHSVSACLCVLAAAVATSLLALWLQQWRLVLNVGRAPCLQQAATGTAAHLACQRRLCLPGIYLATLLRCVCICVRWIGSAMRLFSFFAVYSGTEKSRWHNTRRACTQMSRGGDLFENTLWEALGDVRAIIVRLSGEGGDGERWYGGSSGMWEGLMVNVISSKQLIMTDDGSFSVI